MPGRDSRVLPLIAFPADLRAIADAIAALSRQACDRGDVLATLDLTCLVCTRPAQEPLTP